MYNPKVTIIIPVYNGSKYIAEAIDSALSQTYANIEVLVIDDGSTDNTKEIVERYKDKVEYYYKDNGGVASALNYGIDKAKGQYISWLSHDDLFLPDKLINQVAILATLPKAKREKTVIYSSYREMNEELVVYGNFEPHQKYPTAKLEHPYYPALFGFVNGCTTLIPIKCLKDIGLFNEDLAYTQDIDMWFRLFPKVKVKYQPGPTLISRKHRLQGINKFDINKTRELNDLYKNMVNKLTSEQMIEMCGSEEQFLKDVLKFVYELKYLDAAEYLELRLRKLEEKRHPSKSKIYKRIVQKIVNLSPYRAKIKQERETQERLNSKIDYLQKKIEALNIELNKKEERLPSQLYIIAELIRSCKYTSYLELGIYYGATYNNIKSLVKIAHAVDIEEKPFIPKDSFFCMSTDEFFRHNKMKYDVIFIDADHSYEQVKKDFTNSLEALEDGGIIILHDTDPMNKDYTAKNRCGDSYKMNDWLKAQGDLQFVTIPMDEAGLTIVNRYKDLRYKKFIV